MFSPEIFKADLRLNRGMAGGCLSCNEMSRPAFHSRPGFLRNIGAFAHAELVERARADHPRITLTVRHLAGLFCLAFIHAEAAASLKGSVG